MKEATRSAILESAESVMTQQGFQGTRMEEIAAHAGVSVGTLYNYFGDKKTLFQALLDSHREQLMAEVDGVLEEGQGRPFPERLKHFLQVFTSHMQQHLPLILLLMGSLYESSGPIVPMRPNLEQDVAVRAQRLLAAGVSEGALQPWPEGLHLTLLQGVMHSALLQRIRGGAEAPIPEAQAELLARFFLKGAGHPGPV
jgi:AcrR family transcriptional regulator